jgi:hypothetical protein
MSKIIDRDSPIDRLRRRYPIDNSQERTMRLPGNADRRHKKALIVGQILAEEDGKKTPAQAVPTEGLQEEAEEPLTVVARSAEAGDTA